MDDSKKRTWSPLIITFTVSWLLGFKTYTTLYYFLSFFFNFEGLKLKVYLIVLRYTFTVIVRCKNTLLF